MNNATRKQIEKITEKLNALLCGLEDVNSELEGLQSDEQEKYDNLSEGLQASEKGQAIEQAASDLEEAQGAVESAVDSVTEAIDKLGEIG